MKAVVITIMDNPRSVASADRCIASANRFGIFVEKLAACDATKISSRDVLKENGLPSRNFYDAWSRSDRAMACFFSHYSAWALAEAINESVLILEHDAVFKNPVNLNSLDFKHILNLGRPSYGKFVEGKRPSGVQQFFSNPQGYLKGAHAYAVTPEGAKHLIKAAKYKAGPADLFICKQNFKTIQEFYPWPVEVEDDFTTVQKNKGTLAKHRYSSSYEVI